MNRNLAFFNANGCFGKGAMSNPYYYSASELLSQMDRLGIAKSLVWGVEARDYNAVWGNRKLIDEISAAGADDRLVPAFTISPLMLYEEGAMEALKKDMEAYKVRALRIFPGALMHTLKQIEPVIDEIRRFKPVLFCDSRDMSSPDELLNLAGAFPDVPMVYMQAAWAELPAALDLLRRRDNIYIDTSWLNPPHTMEMIAERFGADRLLFGAGYRSHNGASMAALYHSDLSDPVREKIAHQNLEKLLGLPEYTVQTGSGADDSQAESNLWYKLMNGKDLDIDIVDAHGHLGPFSTLINEKAEIASQLKYVLPMMKRLNIGTMLVSGAKALLSDSLEGNRYLEESLRPYEGCFKGYLSFNPLYKDEMLQNLDHFFSRNFYIGFKIHCDFWKVPVTDPRFIPMWEYADRYRLPILLHTWEGIYDSPAMLSGIVPRYPNATFILGHSGGGDAGRLQAEELALSNSNVYLEYCGSFTSAIPYEETIKRVGCDRVLFGTDDMFHNPAWETGRALSMDLPEEMLVPMLGANMRRILSLRRK